MHEAFTRPTGAVCFVAALRWLWLLPDWLAKWQSLADNRRGLRRRAQAELRPGTGVPARIDQRAAPARSSPR
jgi:hypothetical protein